MLIKNFLLTFIIINALSCTSRNEDKTFKPTTRDITVKAGESFEVKFIENPSINLHAKRSDENSYRHVLFVSKEWIPKEKKVSLGGSDGVTIYTFKAISKGIDTLKFEFREAVGFDTTVRVDRPGLPKHDFMVTVN